MTNICNKNRHKLEVSHDMFPEIKKKTDHRKTLPGLPCAQIMPQTLDVMYVFLRFTC